MALEDAGMAVEREQVKEWYDGFTFGTHTDIYNPWSIIKFLDSGKYEPYWTDTSSNGLTNYEVQLMFDDMIHDWFETQDVSCNDFIKDLIKGDLKAMNHYMNKVALATFSFLILEILLLNKQNQNDFIMDLFWGLWWNKERIIRLLLIVKVVLDGMMLSWNQLERKKIPYQQLY